MATWEELTQFLDQAEHPFRLREDADLEHVHWATTRERVYDELLVLAMDHRSQFEDLAEELGVDLSSFSRFKTLAVDAVEAAAQGDSAFGVLLDGRYGLELNEWPLNHVVKCLVFYHPDDEADLRERQERQLLRLFDACRKTRHELLIEVILPADMPMDSGTVARAIRRLYSLGIRPDWWKLEPAVDPDAWRAIEAAIVENDPYCRGVLVLGLSAPEAELIASFAAAAPFSVVKGFAVGRTIFYDVARDWLAGRIDSGQAVQVMTRNLTVLAQAWRRVRGAGETKA
jgi:5-dehydro-2-deoxygluconokinase